MAKSNTSRPPKKSAPPVPVLTEVVDEGMADIPTLTEIYVEQSAPLTDAQCQQLVAQIAPQLESLLREKFAQHCDTLLQEVMHDVQSTLPALIRATLNGNIRQ